MIHLVPQKKTKAYKKRTFITQLSPVARFKSRKPDGTLLWILKGTKKKPVTGTTFLPVHELMYVPF